MQDGFSFKSTLTLQRLFSYTHTADTPAYRHLASINANWHSPHQLGKGTSRYETSCHAKVHDKLLSVSMTETKFSSRWSCVFLRRQLNENTQFAVFSESKWK